MVITKGRNNTVAWVVYHIGLAVGNEIYLSATNAQASSTNYPTAPTSTVVNLGNDTNANKVAVLTTLPTSLPLSLATQRLVRTQATGLRMGLLCTQGLGQRGFYTSAQILLLHGLFSMRLETHIT
jgi:hypothetical protein